MNKSTHTPEYAALRSEMRAAREKAQLSQRDLAAILKVHHSWVAKVETGERRIDVVEMHWFLAACDADAVAAITRILSHSRKSFAKPGGRTK